MIGVICAVASLGWMAGGPTSLKAASCFAAIIWAHSLLISCTNVQAEPSLSGTRGGRLVLA